MAKLFMIFSLVFCVSGWSQSFRQVDGSNNHDRLFLEAQSMAISWINKAKEMPKIKQSTEHTNMVNTILNNANQTHLFSEKEGVMAPACYIGKNGASQDNYARVDSNLLFRIFLCRHLLTDFSNNIKAIAQVIVHEYYHVWESLAGFSNSEFDESYAHDFELSVTNYVNGCIFYSYQKTTKFRLCR